jgi:predicted N-acetyltransferase YhbS
VAALHHQIIRHRSGPPPEGLEAAFRRVFLDGPVVAPDLPSLVMEVDGAIVGFQGLQVREFEFDGKRRKLASMGPVFVTEKHRALASGAQLIRMAMHGAQDLTISDAASLDAARIWEHLGGRAVIAQTFEWRIPLAPNRLALAAWQGRRSRLSRLFGRAATPLAGALDRAGRAKRVAFIRSRPGPRTESVAMSAARYAELAERMAADVALKVLCPPPIADWIFSELNTYPDRGELVAREVRDGRRTLGWFIGHAWPDGVFRVMQLHAHRRAMPAVVKALLTEALARDLAAVCGRVEEPLAIPLAAYGARIDYGPWMLVHAGDKRIEDAVLSLDSNLSMLDGERLMYIRGQAYQKWA